MKYADFKIARDDFITCSNFMNFAAKHSDIVFLKTDVVIENKAMEVYKTERPHPKSGFPPREKIWITSHSDFAITDSEVLRNSEFFSSWFAVNADTREPRVNTLPLGLNYESKDAYDLLFECMQQERTFQNWAFMSFNIHTNEVERSVVDAEFQEKSFITRRHGLTQAEYYSLIKRHPFVICPKGNGYDTHRFWEALYLGAIPVVRENPVVRAFEGRLPMVIVKNWSYCTEEYLEYEYTKILNCDTYDDRYLKQSYWFDRILDTVTAKCQS